MGRRLSKTELMHAATLIQNKRIMPRQVKAEDVVNRAPFLESPITGMPAPTDAEQVAGKSDGIQNAKRAEAETSGP